MSTKKAIVKQVRGIALTAKADSNHWVVMDGSPEYGGSNAGATPKELLLMALGGCTAMDIIPILKKRKVPVENLEIRLTGTVRDEHPKVFTEIHVEYIFTGFDIEQADVERAIELSSTKYCAVSAMLRPTVKITNSYRIVKEKLDA